MSFRHLHKLTADEQTRDEITRVAANLYDEPRDLKAHEQLFLSAMKAIRDRFNSYRGGAAKDYGWQSDQHKAVVSMADRQEAKELRDILQNYRNECARRSGDYDDSEPEEFLIAAE